MLMRIEWIQCDEDKCGQSRRESLTLTGTSDTTVIGRLFQQLRDTCEEKEGNHFLSLYLILSASTIYISVLNSLSEHGR